MSRYKFAHFREQGQDMIVVPLEPSFGNKSSDDQHAFIAAFQACTRSAQLPGTVVPIWRSGNRVNFIAPQPWHGFFRSAGIWNLILANINKELTI